MSTFKSSALALAILGAVTAAPAQAYVMASSVVQLSDFRIYLSSNGTTLGNQADASDFTTLNVNSNADLSGDLTGYTGFSLTSATPETDFSVQCIGSGCGALALGENAFTNLAPPPVGDYSAGDQIESGSPILNYESLSSPATIKNSAYAALLTGSGDGSANSNNGLSATFEFSLEQDSYLAFTGLVAAYMNVAMTADEVSPGTAQASYQFSFVIADADGIPVWSFIPDLLALTGQVPIGVNAPVATDRNISRTNPGLNFSVFTPLLTTGVEYTLTARSNANVDVTRTAVPEPGILALLGLGLVGMGLARRAQKRA